MPKNYRIGDIKRLLERISIKTGESLDHYGAGQISDKLNGSVSQKYLYDGLLRRIQKSLSDEELLSLAPNKVDELAKFIDFKNFDDFILSTDQAAHPVLEGLIGSYYCYLRKNAIEGTLLQSPVNIYKNETSYFLLLNGPQYSFEGSIRYNNGCLFCLMESKESGKSFYHIYKIGKSITPTILMGIFSGISSSNDPIGGRCLLERREEGFYRLKNEKFSINELNKLTDPDKVKLAQYFKTFEENNLRINVPYGFDFDDLV